MKALLKIVISWILVTAVAFGGYLWVFSYEYLSRFLQYKVARQHTHVIFGASYADYLPTKSPIYNLGVAGSNPREHLEILRFISGEDTPVYLMSLSDVLYADAEPRSVYINPFNELERKKQHMQWQIKRKNTDGPSPRLPQRILLGGERTMDSYIELLKVIRHLRSDTVFVLTPICFDDEKLDTLHKDFTLRLEEEDFQIVDLSRSIPKEEFESGSVVHVQVEARVAIVSSLQDIIKREGLDARRM